MNNDPVNAFDPTGKATGDAGCQLRGQGCNTSVWKAIGDAAYKRYVQARRAIEKFAGKTEKKGATISVSVRGTAQIMGKGVNAKVGVAVSVPGSESGEFDAGVTISAGPRDGTPSVGGQRVSSNAGGGISASAEAKV